MRVVSLLLLVLLAGCTSQNESPQPTARPAAFAPPAPSPEPTRTTYQPPRAISLPPQERAPVASNTEIETYLSRLAQIEAEKKNLLKRHEEQSRRNMASFQSLRDRQNPEEYNEAFRQIAQTLQQQIAEYQQLEQQIQNERTPNDCHGLHRKYLLHIQTIRKVEEDTLSAFNQPNPTDSLHQLRQINENINAFLQQTSQDAENEMQSLCARLGVSKTFSIGGI